MSRHGAEMAERLPLLYRDGELVRALLDVAGLQIEMLDDAARRIQRRHWFDTAPDFDDAARLGELLDIMPESWQSLGEYRAWFHALRTARLAHGAGTVTALRSFVQGYADAFEATDAIGVLPDFDSWHDVPTAVGHAFIEQPERPRRAPLGSGSELTPLHRQTVVNGGLDPSPLQWVMTGSAAGPEYVPVVANVTSGTALVYLGAVGAGERLWVRTGADGEVVADLEGRDVTDQLRTVTRLDPGVPWDATDVADPAGSMFLEPGPNELWFLPVAHFDAPGLDRVLLALADLEMRQARWDETTFDHALFFQDPAATLHLLWHETTPATVHIDLDGAVLRSPAGRLDEGIENRDQLAASLDQGVRALSAAGVATSVRLRPFVSSQRQRDRLVVSLPLRHAEIGTIGIDKLPDAGGIHGVTDFDDSTYR